MGELVAERIIARLAHFRLDAGQIGQMQVHPRELVPGEVFRDCRGHEAFVLGDIVENALAIAGGDENDTADGIECGFDAFQRLLRNQVYTVIAAVGGEFDSEAIDDAAAQWREQSLIDAILIGASHELFAFEDLQLVEPRAERGKHGRNPAAHHQGAPREGRVPAFVLAVEQRHQNSLRNGPTSRRWIRLRRAAPGM